MSFLTEMYPQDKANHYMRGSFVAGVVAAIFIVIVSALERRVGAIPLLWNWALVAAAVVGWLAAFFAGL